MLIVASAPADTNTRDAWLERLWAAHEADQIPYIEQLADHWGDLCASKELASGWADGLLNITLKPGVTAATMISFIVFLPSVG